MDLSSYLDEVEEKAQPSRIESAAAGGGRAAGNFINTAIQWATQPTQRFIRWVLFWIYRQAPWDDSILRLREVWGGIHP